MSEKTGSRRVLDSHAVLTLLRDEPHAATVERAINDGEAWMTLVNLGEVAYIVERRQGRAYADEIWSNLLTPDHGDHVPIRILDLDAALARRAASIKSHGGISYADAFAAAAAERLGCPVLTGDPEFTVAEQLGIAVDWLR